MNERFLIKDCALVGIATGESASSLFELKEIIARVPISSLYHHFWGGRLRPSFAHPDYLNDFASWAHFSLHDNVLSERLGNIDPTGYTPLEGIRGALIDIIETRLDEVEFTFWSKSEAKFHFLRAITIVFDTEIVLTEPSELKNILPTINSSSIFYHFIDGRRRTPDGVDDFTFWLRSFDGQYADLIAEIQHIDPFFLELTEIKSKLINLVNHYIK